MVSSKISPLDEKDHALDKGFEIDQYVRALGESSSRVRFVMLAVIVASVASMTTLWSEHDGAWERLRLETFDKNYFLAKTCKIWDYPALYKYRCQSPAYPDLRIGPKEGPELSAPYIYLFTPPECQSREDDACKAINYFNKKGISTEDGAKVYAEKQWEAYINNVTYVKTPILGLIFDINDLGLITGLTFSILMLVMVFYSNRAHENLALSMWKVREIAERDNCFDDPDSRANLLYHALAIQQVFTVPPTLARWHDIKIFRKSHYILFLLPFFVQLAVLRNDFNTRPEGFSVSTRETWISLGAQGAFLLFVFSLCLLCCAHLNADDKLWERVFIFINPGHKFQAKSMWRHWVKITDNRPPAWGLAVRPNRNRTEPITPNEVLFIDSINHVLWSIEIHKHCAEGGFPIRRLSELKGKTWARGLYLETKNKEHRLYSKAGQEKGFGEVPKRKERLRKSIDRNKQDDLEYLTGLTDSSTYDIHLSKSSISRIDPKSKNHIWSAGGLAYQNDGWGMAAGFAAIHALLPDDDTLFVTDGAWIRNIKADGEVRTWGGRPLGEHLRPERPFLLGMTLTDNRPIKAQTQGKGEISVTSKLLVCDYTLRRVIAVNEYETEEVYRSDRCWAPTGIFIDGNTLYLLEYRQATMVGEWINYLLRTKPQSRILRFTFFFWPYLRIMKFDNCSFNEGKILYKLSNFRLWRDRSKTKDVGSS